MLLKREMDYLAIVKERAEKRHFMVGNVCSNRRHDHTCNHYGNIVDKVYIEGRPYGRNERLKNARF